LGEKDKDMENLRDLFLLDPELVFLNHGSFGATPKPVFHAYQSWQERMERQPVLFLGRELDGLLYEARKKLGIYLNASTDDLVFIPNATHGVNIVARSLKLDPGSKILTSDHEYGACDYTWEFVCSKIDVKYVHQNIHLPVDSEEEIINEFWQGVDAQTKAIYLSMITSPTALIMPIKRICQKARENGILTIVDAAHGPGQIKMDLNDLGADIVFGNCHKWMLSPKGAAFLYVRKELQVMVEPLIVSWGSRATKETTTGSSFIDNLQWTGTKDPAAYLSVPTAIQFMEDHHWEQVQSECHNMLRIAINRICALYRMDPLYSTDSKLYAQMGIAPLPGSNLVQLKKRLYTDYKVEVPLIQWKEHQFVRISIQGYNSIEDVDSLINGLSELLPVVKKRNYRKPVPSEI
jgi:isopenicillin-N epimerase